MNNHIELLETGLRALNDKRYALEIIRNNCDRDVATYAFSQMEKAGMVEVNRPLSEKEITINLNTYCETLWLKIQNQNMHNRFVSYNSMKILYDKSEYLNPEYILYSNELSSLKVSDLLDTIKYCLDFVDIVFDIDTEQYSNCVTALKALEKFMNNQDNDRKNLLKDLGYALEVFIAVANHFETNETLKKENKIASMLVNFSIKFLAG
ncbi:MAG: hypothetical protein LUG16_03630 [Candidatus Gastranaerophilales bacterium]|nr:hypothetical protein [Candidatus Gastranaerophilales bacterium]